MSEPSPNQVGVLPVPADTATVSYPISFASHGRIKRISDMVDEAIAKSRERHGSLSGNQEWEAQNLEECRKELLHAYFTRSFLIRGETGLFRYATLSCLRVVVMMCDGSLVSRFEPRPDRYVEHFLQRTDSVVGDYRDVSRAPAVDRVAEEYVADLMANKSNRFKPCCPVDVARPRQARHVQWQMSGIGTLLAREYAHHPLLLQMLAQSPKRSVSTDATPGFDVMTMDGETKAPRLSPTPAIRALSSLKSHARKIGGAALRGNGITGALLLNPDAMRAFSRQHYRTRGDTAPDAHLYAWMTVGDAVTCRYRIQFATLYPEWVQAVVNDTGFGNTLRARIDAGLPVDAAIREKLGWPKWVSKTLRGRMSASKFIDYRYATGEGVVLSAFSLGQFLGELGPRWAPRRNDLSLSVLASKTFGSSIGMLKRIDDGLPANTSPWSAFRRVVAGTKRRRNLDIEGYLQDVSDFMGEYGLLVEAVAPLPIGPHLGFVPVGLPELMQMSHFWHQASRNLGQALGTVEPGADVHDDSCISTVSWPALFEDYAAAGLSVRCLTTQSELDRNGREMQHCVGGYGSRCLTGQCHIFIVTQGEACIATGELLLSGGNAFSVRLVQLRAERNAEPPEQAQAIADALVRRLNHDGLQEVAPAILHRGRRYRDANRHTGGRLRNLPNLRQPYRLYAWLEAWQPAMPEGMRQAWNRQHTPTDRIAAVSQWVMRHHARPIPIPPFGLAA